MFYYKEDILRNLKTYGLYNKSNKKISNNILYKLGKLPFQYNSNIDFILEECKKINTEYPLYTNFINNYFLKFHLDYFKDNSLNYSNIPKDCRSNSFLENYNGIIKRKLGKNRIVNWVNFINFIKDESSRSLEKLMNYYGTAENKSISKNSLKNYIDNNEIKEDNEDNKIENFELKKGIETQKDNIKIDIKDIILKIKNSKLGFKNMGDTCYFNTSLQILIHLEKFLENILNMKSKEEQDITKGLINFIIDLYKILDLSEINPLFNNSLLYYTPEDFKETINFKFPQFKTGQHDSMELLRILLNELIIENNIQIKADYK